MEIVATAGRGGYLYGNTQKVLWCCDELGIAYEREDARRGFGKNHEPAYLALNPNGRVPTMVDDGGYTVLLHH